MAYVEADAPIDRSDLVRWTIAAAVVLALHGLAAFALSMRSDDADAEAGTPVVMIEFAPVAAAPPAPSSDYAPGPQQMQAAAPEQPEETKPERKEPDPIRVPDAVPAANPAVAVPEPVPEPPKERIEEKVKVEPQEQVPVPTAPPPAPTAAPQPAAPAPGHVARPSAAAMAWNRSLVAHLEGKKRYPPEADGEHGVVTLGFTIDRAGHVLSSRIIRSSGSAVLDRETLAMVKRAQPLPRPPSDLSDDLLSVNVAIRYSASDR